MNIVFVLIDSLNRNLLGAYAHSPYATPNLDAFAARALRFDNHFVGSLACMPARREIYSGFKEMMWRPWGPLECFDARLPRLLEAKGYTTALVTDHYHYWEEEANGYHQAFQSTELVRGHELDPWKAPVREGEPLPRWVENVERWRPAFGTRYYANVKDFTSEQDFFPAKVMTAGSKWLEENSSRAPFFLQVESFDVHEPFDVPEPYRSMYGDGGLRDEFTIWPPYQDPDVLAEFMAGASPEELEFIRSQYGAKLTMTDRWFGELTATLDRLGLWDDTMVVVTTDHGHDLGERNQYAKQYPHYDSHANIPLFIHHPRLTVGGTSTKALTGTVDLFATVLDAAGVEPPATHSRSFLPVLENPEASERDAHLYGTFGQGVCVTDGEWTLFKAPQGDNQPLFAYSSQFFKSLAVDFPDAPVDQGHFIPGVRVPQWKIPVTMRPRTRDNHLFHRQSDPGQEHNLWDENPEQRERMLTLLRDLIEAEGAPDEQWERLGLERPRVKPGA